MKQIIKNTLILLFGTVVLAGCLKNNDLYEGYTDLEPLADIPLSHLSSDTLTIYALPVASSPDATIDTLVAVHLSDKKHVGDVTFTLGLGTSDPAFVTFMSKHPEYTLMPSNLYSFDSSVVIKDAGVLNTANISVKFKTAAVDADGNNLFLSNEYVLPIIIKDAGGFQIASNFRMIVMRVLAKNQYDGVYTVTGTFTDLTNPAFSGDYPKSVSLVTEGSSKNAYYDGDLEDFGYVFYTGTSYSYFGNLGAVFTFDADGNVTDVSNYYNDPAPRSRNFKLDTSPGTVNKYDFATKTLDVSYLFMQSGAIRGKIHEKWTYKGPR